MIAHNNIRFEGQNPSKYNQHKYQVSYRLQGTLSTDDADYSTSFEAINNISAMAMACAWLEAFPNTKDLLNEPWVSYQLTKFDVLTKGRRLDAPSDLVEPGLTMIID